MPRKSTQSTFKHPTLTKSPKDIVLPYQVDFTADIKPRPAVKTTKNSKWNEKSVNYQKYLQDLKFLTGAPFGNQGGLPIEASLVFTFPIPKSWTKKKFEKEKGKPHTQKPDIDNLTKPLFDALLSGCDGKVFKLSAVKKWDISRDSTGNIQGWFRFGDFLAKMGE